MPGLSLGFGLNPPGAGLSGSGYRFGFRYNVPDLANIVANMAINNEVINAAIGFDIVALKSSGLTKLAVDAQIQNLEKFSDKGVVTVGEKVEFSSGDIGLGLRAVQLLPIAGASDMALRFHVFAQYAMGDITPRLDGALSVGGTANGDYRGNFDGISEGTAKDTMGIVINPNVAIKVGGGTITLGYSAMVTSLPSTSVFNNAIYAHFNVGF
jgi:hypothetical protein